MLHKEYGDRMPKHRRSRKLTKVSVNLPKSLLQELDDIAEEAETDRTDIIQGLLEYGLDNIDDVFAAEDEEEGESEEEASEEAESED
jgi:hypothetical protein